jgi:HD-GYP domain-containing protein (c-di-GMP phosphodiesterase class II)
VDVKNIKTDARAAAWQAEAISRGYYAGIVFPLATNNQLLGSLCIFAGRDHHIDQDEMMLLGEMAEDLAFGIFTLRVGEEKRRAEKLLEKSNLELEASYDATLAGWSRALELRERETAGHSARVVNLVERLAKRMGLSGQQVIHLRRGALLHDIGKMGIPDSILLKQGPLNPGEWDIMQKHTLYASRLLTDIPYLMPALEIPLYHHERWDGSGYPYGLRDEQIPLAARIFAIVDVWDALTNDRPYHQAMLNREALAYLQANAGKLFDPKVCEAFLEMLDDQRK